MLCSSFGNYNDVVEDEDEEQREELDEEYFVADCVLRKNVVKTCAENQHANDKEGNCFSICFSTPYLKLTFFLIDALHFMHSSKHHNISSFRSSYHNNNSTVNIDTIFQQQIDAPIKRGWRRLAAESNAEFLHDL